MLSLLHIENIALIDRADLTFGPGFNVLTGETGAGKSIIIDAISENDTFLNGLDITAEIERPDGEKFSITLPQTAPGFYETTIPLSIYGAYQARADLKQGDEDIGVAQKTFAMPYALEFAQPAPTFELLDAIAETAGGKVDPDFATIADPEGFKIRSFTPLFYYFLWIALVCLILDVLFRRIRFALK